MCVKGLSDEVKIFITKYLESTQQLEILLLLFNRQNKTFNSNNVSFELRSNVYSSKSCMDKLSEKGLLVKKKDNYQFCSNNDLYNEVKILSKAYQEYKYSVINYIYSKPMDNIRSFSYAFKIHNSIYLLPVRRKTNDLNNC